MIAENIDKTYELRDANGQVIESFQRAGEAIADEASEM
jgi:hypothetical protein